ncbi:uncharacterized protein LOC112089879 [Eutrema salsugineum]|uniref:uncharacterized protein LOC112089879 n=1 Tax=Eutrema salsugineum TaxID=72664 RepID=UPI000CECF705|nr:uncharacterized protein LOC112089879 [Eutrema salsugineum]
MVSLSANPEPRTQNSSPIIDPVTYVAEYYYTHKLRSTYSQNIKPVNGDKLWKRVQNKPPIGIPEIRKPRGRPKNRDMTKEPFEDLQNPGKATRHGRIPHCSRCGQAGHINRGCKNEPVVNEGPKNKRGRPRKNPAEERVEGVKQLAVQEIDEHLAQVTGVSSLHVVNLERRTCTCRCFDIDKIPYVHAVAAAEAKKDFRISLAHPYYGIVMPRDIRLSVPEDIAKNVCLPP